jgi:hypothetical protein
MSMPQPYSMDPDELIARVEREAIEAQQRAVKAQDLADGIAGIRGEASSPRREVSLTVDVGGKIATLALSDDAMDLSPNELSALIIATATRAQKAAGRQGIALTEQSFGVDSSLAEQVRAEYTSRIGSLDDDDDRPTGLRW